MPTPIEPAQALEALRWRNATKAFDPSRKLSPQQISTLEQTLVLTPSSFGLQPWRFLFITNPELRQKLRPHAWNQSQVTDASHLVILAARTVISQSDIDRFIGVSAAVRHVSTESLSGYQKMIEGFAAGMSPADQLAWNQRQVYIALGNLMTTAAVLGIDTCPIEGFDPNAFDEILGLPALGFRATVLCALGYRSESDAYASAPKVRYSPGDIVEHRD